MPKPSPLCGRLSSRSRESYDCVRIEWLGFRISDERRMGDEPL
jgi:hypothetical protein